MMDEYALPRYRDEIPLKEGVEDYLRRMKAMGVRLNILTASPHKMLDPCLKRLGVWELFDKVWSCDDLGTVKSDPEIYRIAARELGVRTAEVAFFDDNLGAVRTAASAGMFTVAAAFSAAKRCGCIYFHLRGTFRRITSKTADANASAVFLSEPSFRMEHILNQFRNFFRRSGVLFLQPIAQKPPKSPGKKCCCHRCASEGRP